MAILPNPRSMVGRYPKSGPERFSALYVPDPNSGCWLWFGCDVGRGYGTITVDGVKRGAHRYSWELHYGHIPEGMDVCHSCDVPACVNPRHLFLGTHAENMRDMQAKGRARWVSPALKGERHGSAKLTEADVREIRSATGFLKDIAARFGVSMTTVHNIRARKLWAHIN